MYTYVYVRTSVHDQSFFKTPAHKFTLRAQFT